MSSTVADAVRAVVVPFLWVTGTLLAVLVCHVLLLHGVREVAFRRRRRLRARYGPLLSAVLHDADPAGALERLRTVPPRHLPVVGGLLLEPLRNVKGGIADRSRAAAAALGLTAVWEAALRDRRWWIRTDAAHALGLVRQGAAVDVLIVALDDPVEEVRAAAVEALGRIADPVAVPELVARLADGSRHQRVRLVEALQQFGAAAVAPLLAHARAHPENVKTVAELLGALESASAIASLLDWCADERVEVREAAVRAVGAIGPDDRAYYHLLRALADPSPDVRAAAAWALGRSGREAAAAYLAPRLHDDWIVAAQTARALRALGATGRRALEDAAAVEHGELARQILWEAQAGARA